MARTICDDVPTISCILLLMMILILFCVSLGDDKPEEKRSCLPHRYIPTNVSIETRLGKQPTVMVDGKEFEMKGIGYSPILPGKHTLSEEFDYFTGARSNIWKRDIPIIANMGANIIRTWSWDATKDHSSFLDECDSHGLKVLVPFLMTQSEYPNIADPDTHKQILMDWKAFIKSVKNHPALFGYMVGNEINEEFAGQLEELFSTVNSMVAIRDEEDDAKHPVTVPFSDNQFLEILVDKYYPWLNIDFWSLQIYRNASDLEKVARNYSALFEEPQQSGGGDIGKFHKLPIKPLILTEYGIDALKNQTCESWGPTCGLENITRLTAKDTPIDEDQEKQAFGMCQRYKKIKADDYLSGGVVMEYVDEWWKGTFPDVRRLECPNQRSDIHTYCAQDINKNSNKTVGADFLHEEWLGLFEQIPSLYSDYALIQDMEYCIKPRLSYCVISRLFSGGTKSCNDLITDCVHDETTWKRKMCASGKTLGNNIFMMWLAPCLLVVMLVFGVMYFRLGKSVREIITSMFTSCICWKMGSTSDSQDEDVTHKIDEAESPRLDKDSETQSFLAAQANDNEPSVVKRFQNEVNEIINSPNNETTSRIAAKIDGEITEAFWNYTISFDDYEDFMKWCEEEFSNNRHPTINGYVSSKNQPCPFFAVSQRRLRAALIDNYQRYTMETDLSKATGTPESYADELMYQSCRVVYERYMEGYSIYLDKKDYPDKIGDRKTMIKQLTLYFIIQQWSGTINHAPEKVMELLDWGIRYFDFVKSHTSGEGIVSLDAATEEWKNYEAWIKDFHLGLVEIVRTYIMKVQGGLSFDDISRDSVFVRKQKKKSKLSIHKEEITYLGSTERETDGKPTFFIGSDGDILPQRSSIQGDTAIHGTNLEYNSACKPEECVTSSAASQFFDSRWDTSMKQLNLKFFGEPFPLVGGIFPLIVNFSWLIRYIVWQNLLASFLQPNSLDPQCPQEFVTKTLAFFDCLFKFLSYFCHWVLLGRFTLRLKIEFFVYLFVAVILVMTRYLSPYSTGVCKYLDGSCEGNVSPTLAFGFALDAPGAYIIGTVLHTMLDELRLFVITQRRMDGRFKSTSHLAWCRSGYVLGLLVFIIFQILQLATSFYSFDAWDWWPTMSRDTWYLIFPALSMFIGFLLSRQLPKLGQGSISDRANEELLEESRYIMMNAIFWGFFFVLNWLLAFYIMVPAVNNITLNMCECDIGKDSDRYLLTTGQVNLCAPKIWMMCYVAVIFTWISAYLVSFVFLYAVFELILLVFGIVRAKYTLVGNVKDWNDVERHWTIIMKRSLPRVSSSLGPEVTSTEELRMRLNSDEQCVIWNNFVQSLAIDYLLSEEETKALTVIWASGDPRDMIPNFRQKPRSSEAQRRIISYLWGLESLDSHDGNNEKAFVADSNGNKTPITSNLRKGHRVLSMPTLTTLVPAYNEAILYTRENLTKTRKDGKTSKRITEIEYLSLVHVAEWQNFAQKMKKEHDGAWIVAKDDNIADDLLHSFVCHDHPAPLDDQKDAELIKKIERWASMRGQTLGRTVTGLCNQRLGLLQLLTLEEKGKLTPCEVLRMVSQKYQILIAHQTFDLSNIGTGLGNGEDHLVEVFREQRYFEIVINDDTVFQSHCLRLRDELLFPTVDDVKESSEIQSDYHDTLKVINKSEEVLGKKINKQLDTLMSWSRDKTRTVELPPGTLIRCNKEGSIQYSYTMGEPSKGGEPTENCSMKLKGGVWTEGKIISYAPYQSKSSDSCRMEVSKEFLETLKQKKLNGSADINKLSLAMYRNTVNGLLIKERKSTDEDDLTGRWVITSIKKTSEAGGWVDITNMSSLQKYFSSHNNDMTFEVTISKLGDYTIMLSDGTTSVFEMERVQPFPWTQLTVQRVSQLRIGEGKAENQIHALPFATGDVLQAMDMNQYATSDQAIKIPFLLNDFFSTPNEKSISATPDGWDHQLLIPKYRIVGFPEWCYTRHLSMVGDLMGAAEWCFVTINQRVLSWPLRIRTHYGHPDFFDGYWARTRGGTSKATPVVNTNEDIFAGYEMLSRGERGCYVEFLECHKGRETAFPNAYVFEAKLAQGAAQQIRSEDVAWLNRKLDVFQRFSMFYGSLGFYVTNFIMSISINYYILSIVLFALSGVSYHKLGLLDAVIAIPWLLQIGYVLAIPMVVELVIQRGFWRGTAEFLMTLPVGVFFYVFQLRTKTYYFAKGLFVGAGGYASTGRGFGLDRLSMREMYQRYSESHFTEGLVITICLIAYAMYGSDPIVPFLARTFTIILIAMSWLWAPIMFNPMPTTQELQSDIIGMMDWMSMKLKSITKGDADMLIHNLKTVHTAKRLMLEMNIDRQNKSEAAAESLTPTRLPESTTSEQIDLKASIENYLMEWYRGLAQTSKKYACYSWKRGFAGIAAQRLIPDRSSREKEIIISVTDKMTPVIIEALAVDGLIKSSLFNTIPNLGESFKVQILCDIGLIIVSNLPKEGTETLLKSKLVTLPIRQADGIDSGDFLINVSISNFTEWSENRIPTFRSFAGAKSCQQQHWATENGRGETKNESWRAWYLQEVILDIWQLEDELSKHGAVVKGAIILIKSYLVVEFYFPWVLISWAYFNTESSWVVILLFFLYWLYKWIDQNTSDRHDYPQLIKALALVLIPFIVVYYRSSMISVNELFWSVCLYAFGWSIVTRLLMGSYNLAAKWGVTPFEVKASSDVVAARRHDVERMCKVELQKAEVFRKRLLIPRILTSYRSIVPFTIMFLLAIGNIIAIITSTWLTAMMYNGGVAEAWRKAYFRSAAASPPKDPPPEEGPPEVERIDDSVESFTGGRSRRQNRPTQKAKPKNPPLTSSAAKPRKPVSTRKASKPPPKQRGPINFEISEAY